MKARKIVLRRAANRDIETAVDRYVEEAGERTALGFVQSLEQDFRHIGRHPASGAPRDAQELDLPGLGFWPVKRYPHLVFYVESGDVVDVWRVLHAERDIPALLRIRDAPSV